jgi:hypothetical protein
MCLLDLTYEVVKNYGFKEELVKFYGIGPSSRSSSWTSRTRAWSWPSGAASTSCTKTATKCQVMYHICITCITYIPKHWKFVPKKHKINYIEVDTNIYTNNITQNLNMALKWNAFVQNFNCVAKKMIETLNYMVWHGFKI